jgi:HD-GYP domain-containing protein (c-di-GMP phosphodiesterase class II)
MEHDGLTQTLKYAEGLRELYASERGQRRALEDALGRLDASYRTTVRALAGALELRDDQTGSHTVRVTRVALELTRAAAPELAADPELEYGFLLHDIGKIGILDRILLKPGPLSEEEMDQMCRHPRLGAHLIEGISYLQGVARDVVLHHHERWRGAGYPDGLSGEQIPLAARIFSLADAWDAMTNDRPYRLAMPAEYALAEIRAGAGGQFDPSLVEAFVELLPRVEAA